MINDEILSIIEFYHLFQESLFLKIIVYLPTYTWTYFLYWEDVSDGSSINNSMRLSAFGTTYMYMPIFIIS